MDSLEIIASCDQELGLPLLKMTSEMSLKLNVTENFSDISVKDFIVIFSATSVKFQCYFSEISMIFSRDVIRKLND